MELMDFNEIRREFPALAEWTYLNTATYGQMPNCASAAVAAHFDRRNELACTDFLSWFDDMDRIRELCGRLVNCAGADIAFVHSASAGLAWLMQGLDWHAGDEVLTLDPEFPNQLYQVAQDQRLGIRCQAVKWPDFYTSVTARTRLVLLSTVNYGSGFRPPMEEIAAFLRARNVLLYVDGTQSVGALRFDIGAIQPSMFCVDAYKWLLSPNGAGFVYVSPELRAQLPATIIGWRSDKGWRQPNNLNHGAPVFSDLAEKYEGGMIPFPSLYAMGAVIEMMLELGPAAIEARVLRLAGCVREKLSDLGGEVNTDLTPIVTARFEGHEPGAIAKKLSEERIVVSARQGRLRVSPHFYNNEQDLDTLFSACQRIIV
jgi:cysteine desulfurase / selenocysteine lyase